MYIDNLIYKVVIWVFFGISLWKEAFRTTNPIIPLDVIICQQAFLTKVIIRGLRISG